MPITLRAESLLGSGIIVAESRASAHEAVDFLFDNVTCSENRNMPDALESVITADDTKLIAIVKSDPSMLREISAITRNLIAVAREITSARGNESREAEAVGKLPQILATLDMADDGPKGGRHIAAHDVTAALGAEPVNELSNRDRAKLRGA